MKKFLSTLAYFNIIIALGPVFLTYFTISLLNIVTHDLLLFTLPFLISYFVYCFNRLTDMKEDKINHPERFEIVKKNYYFFVFASLVSLGLSLIISLLYSLKLFIILLLPAIIVVLYSTKTISSKRLKEILGLKNILVSLGWSLIPIYVMIFTHSYIYLLAIIVISIFIFLRIFIGVLMFDVRDVVGDRVCGITTIPVKYGVDTTLLLLNFLNLLSVLLMIIFGAISQIDFPKSLIAATVALIFGVYYFITVKRHSKVDMKFICDVIVDGEYIILGLSVLIFDILVKVLI